VSRAQARSHCRSQSPFLWLAFARQHFFRPHRRRDPFGKTWRIDYDSPCLFAVHTRDPRNNTVEAVPDYRVMQTRQVTDPNGNQTAVLFDALSALVAVAVMGKSGSGPGDSAG